MAKTSENQFLPDYAVLPGEVLDEYLDSYGMAQLELATRVGLTKKHINEVIRGKAPISPATALKLERVFGRPARFWNNLEQQYQEDKARLAEQSRLAEHLDWLKKVPVNHLKKLGWIRNCSNKVKLLEEVLRFFGIASPEQWSKVWKGHQVAYRQSNRYELHAEAISAWLRKGEIEAQKIECAPFERKHFLNILQEARKLTRETPEVFQPRLIARCASAGVAVVFVPELPKTGISGATRWIGGKAVIQLSLRYKSDDHLWFTFFHEAGHIIKHGRKMIFLEGNSMSDKKEEEANVFAYDLLIPPNKLQQFLISWNKSLDAIKEFADYVGVSPGIVVGRLQHERLLPMNTGNRLKQRFKWVDLSEDTEYR